MPRKYVLDTNCFIEASRNEAAAAALAEFSARAAPFLHLSSVVAAELIAGTANLEARQIPVEISNWSTEGFDTADLNEAKALLEELG